jgi:hypothetical protein
MLSAYREIATEISCFRANPWRHQQTFLTPLKDLKRFVETLIEPFPLRRGFFATDQVVFEPEQILEILAAHSVRVENPWEFRLVADGKQSIAELLEAVLGDWIDFCFVPAPSAFAIYADHDEYVTFYAESAEQLAAIVSKLERAGFQAVADYVRPSSGQIWK